MTSPLDSLRQLAAADDTVREELAAATDDESFLAAALASVRRHGIAAELADFASLFAPDPAFLMAQTPPPLRCPGWPPQGWLPCRFGQDTDGTPAIDWADFRGIALDGGFHNGATRLALARPFNRLLRCRTGLGDLLGDPPEGLPEPDGFIFHMSRCGSTLVARLLAALPGSYAVNEPEPLDLMLRASLGAPEEIRVAALRAMVGAFGRRPAQRWFLKLSAWPALSLPLFRRAFPDVPWLFLYRDPAAVLASQMTMRATELQPGFMPSALFGIAHGETLPEEVYCASALARICEAALAAGGGLFVDHADLPDAFFTRILPHFGIGADPAGIAALRDIPRWHARHPDHLWQPKTAPVGPEIRAAADAELGPLYARLKAVQGGQSLL